MARRYERAKATHGGFPKHESDADCTVNPRTGTCSGCSAFHGEPCPSCGGRGYHVPTCPETARWSSAA